MLSSSKRAEKILLINPKDSYILSSPPLGLGYLVSYSRSVGNNEVFYHDENFLPESELDRKLDKAIVEYAPTFVGITFPSSTIKRVVKITKTLKQAHRNITVFAGGYHPTSEPEATLKLIPELDFVMLGQAELPFSDISTDWKELRGVAYLGEDREYIENEATPLVKNLDEIPFIDRRIYNKRYFRPNYVISGIFGKTATIMTSRGCPYNCVFCSNKLLQKKLAFHSADYVLGEIDSIFTHIGRVDYLYFLDVMFLAKWSRVQQLCEALIKSNLLKGMKWAAVVSANAVTPDRVRLMKEAGCFYLSFGFESNSAKVLKLMNKKATPAQNRKAFETCRDLGILCNSAFLFGIQGETENDLKDTLDFIKTYDIFSTGVNVLKPLPGSPYYDELIRKGILKKTIEDWYNISSIYHKSQYFNDEISAEIYEKYRTEFNNVIRWRSFKSHLRVNFSKLIMYKLLKLDVTK